MSAPAGVVQANLDFTQEKAKLNKPLKDPKTVAIVEVACALSDTIPHLKAAFQAEQDFRQAEERELKKLITTVMRAMSGKTEAEVEALKKTIFEKFELDFALMQKLQGAIENNKEATISLQTNKLTFTKKVKNGDVKEAAKDGIIKGSERFLHTYWDTLIRTWEMPQGYKLDTAPADITFLGENPVTLHGSSKATYVKNAFAVMHLAITGKDQLGQATYLAPQSVSHWLDGSALFHLTSIPSNIDLLAIDNRFDRCSYTSDYNLQNKRKGLVFAHSGYAFGGQRGETDRYTQEIAKRKINGPEDCSSWVARITGCRQTYATLHQMWHYENQSLKLFNHKPWEDISDFTTWLNVKAEGLRTEMEALYEPVIIRNPQQDIKAGQVYAYRGAEGGHTALVLGFKSDAGNSKIVGLSYGRDMPEVEGFGVQEFISPHLEMNKAKKTMLFSVSGQTVEAAKLLSKSPNALETGIASSKANHPVLS